MAWTTISRSSTCAKAVSTKQIDSRPTWPGVGFDEPKQNVCAHLPVPAKMMERHPRASQAFVPMSAKPYLVVAAAATPDAS